MTITYPNTQPLSVSKGSSPTAMSSEQQRDYDEVRQEVAETFDDPDLWLETPHQLLGNKPRTLIERGQKEVVINLLNEIRYGVFA